MKISKTHHITRKGTIKANPVNYYKIILTIDEDEDNQSIWRVKVPGPDVDAGPKVILRCDSLQSLKESLENALGGATDVAAVIIDLKTKQLVYEY